MGLSALRAGVLTLLCLALHASGQESAAGSLTDALATGELEEVQGWCTAHPTLVAPRVRKHLLLRLEGQEPIPREELALLREAAREHPIARLVERVRDWTPEERERFVELRAALDAAADSSLAMLPRARLLEWRRTAEELGTPLFLKEAVAMTRRLQRDGRPGDAWELAGWVADQSLLFGDLWTLSWAEEWRAQIAWQRSDLATAAEHMERAAELEARLGDDVYVTRVLADLARIRLSHGDLEGGLAAAESALATARAAEDKGALRMATEVLAAANLDMGQHQHALALCFALLPVDPARIPLDATQVRLDFVAANALSDVGRLESAETFARRAFETSLTPEVKDKAPFLEYEARLTLGLILGDLGRGAEGLLLLDELFAAFLEIRDERGRGWVHKNRGWIHLREGRHAEAAAELDAGREIGARLADPYLEGLCALGVAEALTFGARTAEDLESERIESALGVAGRFAVELHDRQIAWRVAVVRGRMLLLLGSDEEALVELRRAVEGIERWRRRMDAPGLLAHALRDRTDPYREAAFAAARLGRPHEALEFAELLRGRASFERRSRRDVVLAPEEGEALAGLRRRIAGLEFALRGSERDPAEHGTLLDRLEQAEDELDAALLARELRRRGALREDGSAPPVAVAPAAAFEASGVERMLAYLVGEEETLVFVLDGDGLRVSLVPIGRPALESRVERILRPIEELRRGNLDLAHLGFDIAAAAELFEVLVAPFAPERGAALGLLPDDCLTSLPFELLVAENRPGPVDPARPFAHLAELEFLAHRHSTTYFGSLATVRPANATANRGELLLVVPPAEVAPAFAAAEAEAVQRATGGRARLLADADVAAVRAGVSDARVLHLIAHGLLDPEYPTHGHLVFGGDGPGLAGRLEAWQIEDLALDCDLTVLSACDTASGIWLAGEGLRGLTQSFLDAGSRRVVASLWAVDDRTTASFMERLHAELDAGTPTSSALRKARLSLLSAEDPRGFAAAHPYFWAGWVEYR